MPGVLLEGLEADALVAVVKHAAIGAEFVAVILFATSGHRRRHLTWTAAAAAAAAARPRRRIFKRPH